MIGQRERTVAVRPMAGGLVAHTLYEQRDINDAKIIFDDAGDMKTDPEMVKLATQLIDRQTGRYDPADIEDRYETRLRAMIEAKLEGEGMAAEATAEPDRGNVVDLMAALRRSLGEPEKQPVKTATSAREPQPRAAKTAKSAATKTPRKRAS